MPTIVSRDPFLSVRPDTSCGRNNGVSKQSDGHANGHANGRANGHTNGLRAETEDEFLQLSKPQQDVLMLHGPRQKYSLEEAKDIPELHSDRELLVQVLAIGLNPVDWKGNDFDFGSPSYPWVHGRDFAGIVVKSSENASRIKTGDVVFGPSTDYRDIRKAAYQEYVVTSDYNVARIPSELSVKTGAAIGVAFVAAAVALGISLGVDFSRLKNAPRGRDLYELIRAVNEDEIPEDVRSECLENLTRAERPKVGDWLALWGASSTTALMALQLAKLAGLRVICIADVAKSGKKLVEHGADMLVDRLDTNRAIDILCSITGGRLRFAIDTAGKESATLLQDALSRSSLESGLQAHLIGLAGMPKNKVHGVVHHALPIKTFHDVPQIGETIMVWLEQLLLANAIKPPEIEVAEGGLAGINDALDKLRSGAVSSKRIVVPVGQNKEPKTNGIDTSHGHSSEKLAYADKLNAEPDRLKFAYWVPNVSGGLVISKIPQHTNWDLKSNVKYAQTAERVGFEFALSQIRFMAGYGADNQHEPVTFSQALLASTERLKLIAALLPGPWNPAVAAKQIASIDHYSEGRICVNVVSGWFKAEFTSIGQWWLDHAERYRRSREFIACLKGIWTEEKFTFKGDFYQFHDYPLKPKPLVLPGRPYPEIFQGGNSIDARENAANVSDYYFMNGNTLEGFQTQIKDVKERAVKAGRGGQVRFALNGFVIARETEEEAMRVLAEIQGKADKEAVEGFRGQVLNAGKASKEGGGMWAESKFEDLVQYNDGFKTKLIGTPAQIADRILLLKSLGVDILLVAFLHYDEEIQQFGEQVLTLVRKLEKEGRGKDEYDEIRRTGDVYREKKKVGE